MDNQIAVLVPTLNRADRLKSVADNIHKNTKISHKIYFLIERSDINSKAEILRIGENYIFNEGVQYVGAINTGYRNTTEPFIMCASDDLDFRKGWDKACMDVMKDETIGITGPTDSWTISKTKKHISHLFIRRSYIEKYGGVEDEKNTIYSSKYIHIMCDIETEQTAMKRNAFKWSDGFVEHNHWFMGTAEKDATYELCQSVSGGDVETFNSRRKRFEQFLFEDLFVGKVTKINRGLSIVVLSYNCLPYLIQTLDSINKNTYNQDYELIVIDDNSSEQVKSWIKRLNTDGITIKRIFNEKSMGVNWNWNKGISWATKEYVAVLNNDITLSKNWDLYLMDALDKNDLANPYQTDEYEKTPYGKAPRAGDIDIRGTCYMAKKKTFEKIGAIPEELIMWFGDSWIASKVKKPIFVPEAVVHHFCSRSTEEFEQNNSKVFYWIVRGDFYAYQVLTGEARKDLLDAIKNHL